MKFKRIVSAALALSMVVPFIAPDVKIFDITEAYAETETTAPTSGECGAEGSNVTWDLSSDGTLTISGEGAMADWESLSSLPWASYADDIVTVVIEKGVTTIGKNSFAKSKKLTSVTIPDGVTTIGIEAFAHCISLSDVTMPDSVTSIGKYAFYNNDSLTSLPLSKNVKSIGEYVFSSCNSLTEITIPDTVTNIEKHAFESCHNLTSLVIPESVMDIGEKAFKRNYITVQNFRKIFKRLTYE